MTTLLVRWDVDSVRGVKHAAVMSSPSKIIMVPIYRVVKKARYTRPVAHKHPMPSTAANTEDKKLLVMKQPPSGGK